MEASIVVLDDFFEFEIGGERCIELSEQAGIAFDGINNVFGSDLFLELGILLIDLGPGNPSHFVVFLGIL